MGTKSKINRQRKSNERQARMAEAQQVVNSMDIVLPMPWGRVPVSAYVKTVQGTGTREDGTEHPVVLAQVVLIFGDGTSVGLLLPEEIALSLANGIIGQVREVKTGLVTPNQPDIVVPLPRRIRDGEVQS